MIKLIPFLICFLTLGHQSDNEEEDCSIDNVVIERSIRILKNMDLLDIDTLYLKLELGSISEDIQLEDIKIVKSNAVDKSPFLRFKSTSKTKEATFLHFSAKVGAESYEGSLEFRCEDDFLAFWDLRYITVIE